MMHVTLLWHENKNTGDQKLLGVFSSEKEALAAKEYYAGIVGFRENPDGYCLDRYEVDRRQWIEGF